jgi:hypothetical protein
MLYYAIAEDAENSWAAARDPSDHLARLTCLRHEGRLLRRAAPGARTARIRAAGFTGSLVVAHFDDLAAAQAGPRTILTHAGVYARVTVKPFRRVLP